MLEAPIPLKRCKLFVDTSVMDTICNLDPKQRSDIQEKHKTRIAAFRKEKADLIATKRAKIRALIDELIADASRGINGNTKNECVTLALLSLMACHYLEDTEVLTQIASAVTPSLLSSTCFSRAFATTKIVGLLAARQRILSVPDYIYKHEYENAPTPANETSRERFCSVTISPEVAHAHKPELGQRVYVDKMPFGWLCIPPYLRRYSGTVPCSLSKTKAADALGEMMKSTDFMGKLVAEAVLDHEAKEEQRLSKEGNEPRSKIDFILRTFMSRQFGSSDYFSQIFATLSHDSYTIKTKFFNPNQAVFYQSCFEYYGMPAGEMIPCRTRVAQDVRCAYREAPCWRKEEQCPGFGTGVGGRIPSGVEAVRGQVVRRVQDLLLRPAGPGHHACAHGGSSPRGTSCRRWWMTSVRLSLSSSVRATPIASPPSVPRSYPHFTLPT